MEQVLAGEVALPAGPVPEPFVDVEDIENCARVISAYIKTLGADTDFVR